jgi:S-DNA-T family DNA segregation ATPase FtsK/SpoIIIE
MGNILFQPDALELHEALKHLNTECEILGRSEGPRTISYQVRPIRGVTIQRVKSRMDDLAVQLGAEYCICRQDGGRLYIETAKHEPRIPLYESIVPPEDPRDILVGVDTSGQPVTMRLANMVHAIVAGCSGAGKSVALRCLIRGFAEVAGTSIRVVDPKGGGDFGPSRITQIGSHKLSKLWVEGQVKSSTSYAIGSTYNHLRWKMGRKGAWPPSSEEAPPVGDAPLILIVDEIQSLISDRMTKTMLTDLLCLGRSYGIHVILATQAPSAKVLGGNEVRANATTRLVLRVANSSDSRVALTESGAENLLGQGDALFMYNGRTVRLQVPYLASLEEVE